MASLTDQKNSNQQFSQDDLDSLFNVDGAPEETGEAPVESGPDGVALNQDDLDSLFRVDGAPEETGEVPVESAPDGVALNQDDLDSLFNVDGAPEETGEAPVESGPDGVTLNQDDLDSLFNVDGAPEETGEVPVESAPDGATFGEGGLSQSDLDNLFTGESISGEAGVAPAGNAAAPSVDPDEEEMDRLISELAAAPPATTGEVAIPAAFETGAEPPGATTGETDGIFSVSDAPDAAVPGPEDKDDFVSLDDDDLELSGYDETRRESETMEEEIAGEAPADAEPSPEPLTERKKKGSETEGRDASVRRLWLVAAGIALCALVSGTTGIWVVHGKWPARTGRLADEPVAGRAIQSAATPNTVAAAVPSHPDTGKKTIPAAAPPAPHFPPGLEKGLAELDALRNRLMDKRSRIEALRKEYSEKVRQAEDEIRAEAGRREITTLAQARSVRAIELALKTVQRRRAYAQSLDGPAARLGEGSEELLFLKRLTEIDWHLTDAAMGLDTQLLEKRLYTSIRKHLVAPGSLVVDVRPERYPSLESVWKGIGIEPAKRKIGPKPVVTKAAGRKSKSVSRTTGNADILKEIVSGNFQNISSLSRLTPEMARHISTWKGKELFLSDLSHLSSKAAAYLAKWEGSWMALNGLDELSPDVARQLVHWKGDRLSLNGLTALDAASARFLSQWQGKQIEVAGLERLYPDTARLLTQWQRGGGHVFVPERFKRKPSHARTSGPAGPATEKG
jgi:hypothetical protein